MKRRRRRNEPLHIQVVRDDHPFTWRGFGSQLTAVVASCSAVLRLSRAIGTSLCVLLEKWCSGVVRILLKVRGQLTPRDHAELVQKTSAAVKATKLFLEEYIEAGRLSQHLRRHHYVPRLQELEKGLAEVFSDWMACFPGKGTKKILDLIEEKHSSTLVTRDAQMRDLQERRWSLQLETHLKGLRHTVIFAQEHTKKVKEKHSRQTGSLRRRLESLSIDTLGKEFESRHIDLGAPEELRSPATLARIKELKSGLVSPMKSGPQSKASTKTFSSWKVKQNKALEAAKIADVCQDTALQVLRELSADNSSPMCFEVGDILATDLKVQSKIVHVQLKHSWRRASTPTPAEDVANPSWAFEEFQKRVCSDLEIEKLDTLINLSRSGTSVESLADFSGGDRLLADSTRSTLRTKLRRLVADINLHAIVEETLFFFDRDDLVHLCLSALEDAIISLDSRDAGISLVPMGCEVDRMVAHGTASILMTCCWSDEGLAIGQALRCLELLLKRRENAQTDVLLAGGASYLVEVARFYHQSCPLALEFACKCISHLAFSKSSESQLEVACRYLPMILLNCPIKRIFGQAHIAGCLCIASMAKNNRERALLLFRGNAMSYLAIAITRLPRERNIYRATCKALANVSAEIDDILDIDEDEYQEWLKGYKTVSYSIQRFREPSVVSHALNFFVSAIRASRLFKKKLFEEELVATLFELLHTVIAEDIQWRVFLAVHELCLTNPPFLLPTLVEMKPFLTLRRSLHRAVGGCKWLFRALRSLAEITSKHEVFYLENGQRSAWNRGDRDYQLISCQTLLREGLTESGLMELVSAKLADLEDSIAVREALLFVVAVVQVDSQAVIDKMANFVSALTDIFSKFLGCKQVLVNALDVVHNLTSCLLENDDQSENAWKCFMDSRILDHLEAVKAGEKDRSTTIFLLCSCLQNTIRQGYHRYCKH